jgi:hypothetical protein
MERPADERDPDRHPAVVEILAVEDGQHLHEILGRAGVDLAPFLARVDEGFQADRRQGAGLAG